MKVRAQQGKCNQRMVWVAPQPLCGLPHKSGPLSGSCLPSTFSGASVRKPLRPRDAKQGVPLHSWVAPWCGWNKALVHRAVVRTHGTCKFFVFSLGKRAVHAPGRGWLHLLFGVSSGGCRPFSSKGLAFLMAGGGCQQGLQPTPTPSQGLI